MYICIKEINGYKVGHKINDHHFKKLPESFKKYFEPEPGREEKPDFKEQVEGWLHQSPED